MAPGPDSDLLEEAVLVGGALDGNREAVATETEQLSVIMTDGQQHQYLRTDEFQTVEDGQWALIFRWNGRSYGPSRSAHPTGDRGQAGVGTLVSRTPMLEWAIRMR